MISVWYSLGGVKNLPSCATLITSRLNNVKESLTLQKKYSGNSFFPLFFNTINTIYFAVGVYRFANDGILSRISR